MVSFYLKDSWNKILNLNANIMEVFYRVIGYWKLPHRRVAWTRAKPQASNKREREWARAQVRHAFDWEDVHSSVRDGKARPCKGAITHFSAPISRGTEAVLARGIVPTQAAFYIACPSTQTHAPPPTLNSWKKIKNVDQQCVSGTELRIHRIFISHKQFSIL